MPDPSPHGSTGVEPSAEDLSGFTRATVIAAEGARVAVIQCERCGSALLLDPREGLSVVDRHRQWHEHIGRVDRVATLAASHEHRLRALEGNPP